MEELERLRVLLEHWSEHNTEHAQEYKRWAERADALNRKEIAKVLNRLSVETERLHNLFEEAILLIRYKG